LLKEFLVQLHDGKLVNDGGFGDRIVLGWRAAGG